MHPGPPARALAALVVSVAGLTLGGCQFQPGAPTPGKDEVLIPGGTFIMGHEALPMTPDERASCGLACVDYAPPDAISLPPYFIDRYPVTVADYVGCVKAGSCGYPLPDDASIWGDYGARAWRDLQRPAYATLPVVDLSYLYATEYCVWKGKRLPTEAEWEHAARGAGDWDYPWGPDPPTCPKIPETCTDFWKTHPGPANGSPANEVVYHGLYPVGSVPKDRTPTGIYDLYGDGGELVSDYYSQTYYADIVSHFGAGPHWDPQGPSPAPGADAVPHVECAGGSNVREHDRPAFRDLKAWNVAERGIPVWARSPVFGARTFRCAHGVARQDTLP